MEDKKFSIEELCTIFNIDLEENDVKDLQVTIKNIKTNKVVSTFEMEDLFEGIKCDFPINLSKL